MHCTVSHKRMHVRVNVPKFLFLFGHFKGAIINIVVYNYICNFEKKREFCQVDLNDTKKNIRLGPTWNG